MPAFSEDQINEAKERVRRMHARAGAYLPREEGPQEKAPPPGSDKQQKQAPPPPSPPADAEADQEDTAVILMLILLLGHEGADRALLLALLYLLF